MSGADFEGGAAEAFDTFVELESDQTAPEDGVEDAPDATLVGRDPVTGEESGFVSAPADDKARRLGWRPKEDFRGDPARWVDAETFVRRGEEILPFVRANNRQLEKALEKANTEIAEMQDTLRDFRDHQTGAERRAHERALEDRLVAAAEAADVEGVKAATREIADHNRAMEELPTYEAEPLDRGLFDVFVVENPWFEDEPMMRGAAIALAEKLHAQGVTEPRAQLAEVARRIRSEFAHRFENPRRREAAAVEGAPGALRRSRATYSDLPPEARAACDRFVKQGLLTREQFVKDYQWR